MCWYQMYFIPVLHLRAWSAVSMLLKLTEEVSYVLYDHLFHIKLNVHFEATAENMKL